jgi:hypothetical protein
MTLAIAELKMVQFDDYLLAETEGRSLNEIPQLAESARALCSFFL